MLYYIESMPYYIELMPYYIDAVSYCTANDVCCWTIFVTDGVPYYRLKEKYTVLGGIYDVSYYVITSSCQKTVVCWFLYIHSILKQSRHKNTA